MVKTKFRTCMYSSHLSGPLSTLLMDKMALLSLRNAGHERKLQHNGLYQKYYVEEEHDEPCHLCQSPTLAMDHYYNHNEHRQKNEYRYPYIFGANNDSIPFRGTVDDPRDRQPDKNIKNVATDRARYGHIALALSGDNDAR
mmetsp:Transcript_13660/g.22741  ORF Transcript_13660/g.22741 Transcript_13660/m.22741 type:complete len:141 (-) Transcript_13660:589-1011(-)